MATLKFAELTAVIGVLVLGVGLGALLSRWVGAAALPITIGGMAIHAVGMCGKHHLESIGGAKSSVWVVALYSACWLLLAALLGMLLFWSR